MKIAFWNVAKWCWILPNYTKSPNYSSDLSYHHSTFLQVFLQKQLTIMWYWYVTKTWIYILTVWWSLFTLPTTCPWVNYGSVYFKWFSQAGTNDFNRMIYVFKFIRVQFTEAASWPHLRVKGFSQPVVELGLQPLSDSLVIAYISLTAPVRKNIHILNSIDYNEWQSRSQPQVNRSSVWRP